mmetsp:Transcript_14461/g.10425  ORF Transcript_14461/g.10425 Transcript_14461/m.10425 type:complete len:186 (+) Transcript_14461:18-575(+)
MSSQKVKFDVPDAKDKKYMTQTETETETEGVSDAPTSTVPIKANKGTGDEHEKDKRWKAFKVRTITTIIMIAGFLTLVSMGHLYCAILVLWISYTMYKEIISLRRRKDKDEKIIFSWLDWYYFSVFLFYVVPKLFLRRVLFEEAFEVGSFLHTILYYYNNIISFNLFILGVLFFVLSLNKGSYRY